MSAVSVYAIRSHATKLLHVFLLLLRSRIKMFTVMIIKLYFSIVSLTQMRCEWKKIFVHLDHFQTNICILSVAQTYVHRAHVDVYVWVHGVKDVLKNQLSRIDCTKIRINLGCWWKMRIKRVIGISTTTFAYMRACKKNKSNRIRIRVQCIVVGGCFFLLFVNWAVRMRAQKHDRNIWSYFLSSRLHVTYEVILYQMVCFGCEPTLYFPLCHSPNNFNLLHCGIE